jgi:hypothetical protein
MMINRLEQRNILQALIVEDQNVTFIIYIQGTRMNVVLLHRRRPSTTKADYGQKTVIFKGVALICTVSDIASKL